MATTRTRRQADQAEAQTEQATEQARQAAEEAQRTLRAFLVDYAYATVGAGDLAVKFLRSLSRRSAETPQQVASLRDEAPEMLRALRDQSAARVRELRKQAGSEFTELALRGRRLVGAVKEAPEAQEAADQVRVARSQVKAATTSVGKAVDESVEAVGEEVEEQTRPQARREARTDEVDYAELTIVELRELAREAGIEGRSGMSKDELVKALRKQGR